ncbi:MAG TPA: enoyl-CoA hydratase-related protein [Gordonia sp. (in: high G+C Gram-positive bacteria)]|uniref:enoyl-CoA hydratase/isomerase family protein n=1 Tax=unclassified Gordonia (in: high G+C Gram-positive bacteria) TaxID=2657482 RepID=UPI000FABF812|nr:MULTISPECIES: enoyl-CoA hydratase-related protein [unclassified Gordonia (in: high G+C Gram-positive bacteria)]RTL08137.1 MAG: enoyl-CoA hydratase/isomerase family protein [Acidimicrobiia bacterium]HNP57327.1 enoyl-CoA hydratase-related protein [Gordonia sp. (in: high G+C Gram-positive bacteria)]HRC50873.1 enoyl-CoA hydratase-related protein [Gordonia sp. (in: high G+C Gram-positive bacteria)]
MTENSSVSGADGVLSIAVSSPANGTSLDDNALDEAIIALTALLAGQRDERVILLHGSGKNFCAGGNVASFATAVDRTEFLAELADRLHRTIALIVESGRPVVVAAKGWAAGAGMSLTMLGDIVVGGPSTKMRPAYRGIGLSPDGGMTWTLPRIVGLVRARKIILTDQIIDAPEALELGLLTEIVDDDRVDASAREIAVALASGPAAALQATAALLRADPATTLVEQLAAEAASISSLGGRAEGIEGVDAFLGKRKPVWP